MSELNWQRLLASRAAYGVACYYNNGTAKLVGDGRVPCILNKQNAVLLAKDMRFNMPSTFYYKVVPIPYAGDWTDLLGRK